MQGLGPAKAKVFQPFGNTSRENTDKNPSSLPAGTTPSASANGFSAKYGGFLYHISCSALGLTTTRKWFKVSFDKASNALLLQWSQGSLRAASDVQIESKEHCMEGGTEAIPQNHAKSTGHQSLMDVTRIVYGQQTHTFKRYLERNQGLYTNIANLSNDCCFSLLRGEDESIDLSASTKQEASIWIAQLQTIIGSHSKVFKWHVDALDVVPAHPPPPAVEMPTNNYTFSNGYGTSMKEAHATPNSYSEHQMQSPALSNMIEDHVTTSSYSEHQMQSPARSNMIEDHVTTSSYSEHRMQSPAFSNSFIKPTVTMMASNNNTEASSCAPATYSDVVIQLEPAQQYPSEYGKVPVASQSSTLDKQSSWQENQSEANGKHLPTMTNAIGSFLELCANNQLELFEAELARGVVSVDDYSLDVRDGDTAMMLASRLGHAGLVETCLRYGASNDPHPNFGQTALQAAVSHNHLNCARLLLETAAHSYMDGAIVNHTDLSNDQRAPIHTACCIGDEEMVRLLLEHGADVGLVDSSGHTPLLLASMYGHTECVATMIEAGADGLVDLQDYSGRTPLHAAVLAGSDEVVKFLLETAADPRVKDNQGETPYNLAMKRGNPKSMALLREYESTFEHLELPGQAAVPADDRFQSKVRSTGKEDASQHGEETWNASDKSEEKEMYSNTEEEAGVKEQHKEEEDVWDKYLNDDGYPYFVNRTSGTSQWEDPKSKHPHAQVIEHTPVEHEKVVEQCDSLGSIPDANTFRGAWNRPGTAPSVHESSRHMDHGGWSNYPESKWDAATAWETNSDFYSHGGARQQAHHADSFHNTGYDSLRRSLLTRQALDWSENSHNSIDYRREPESLRYHRGPWLESGYATESDGYRRPEARFLREQARYNEHASQLVASGREYIRRHSSEGVPYTSVNDDPWLVPDYSGSANRYPNPRRVGSQVSYATDVEGYSRGYYESDLVFPQHRGASGEWHQRGPLRRDDLRRPRVRSHEVFRDWADDGRQGRQYLGSDVEYLDARRLDGASSRYRQGRTRHRNPAYRHYSGYEDEVGSALGSVENQEQDFEFESEREIGNEQRARYRTQRTNSYDVNYKARAYHEDTRDGIDGIRTRKIRNDGSKDRRESQSRPVDSNFSEDNYRQEGERVPQPHQQEHFPGQQNSWASNLKTEEQVVNHPEVHSTSKEQVHNCEDVSHQNSNSSKQLKDNKLANCSQPDTQKQHSNALQSAPNQGAEKVNPMQALMKQLKERTQAISTESANARSESILVSQETTDKQSNKIDQNDVKMKVSQDTTDKQRNKNDQNDNRVPVSQDPIDKQSDKNDKNDVEIFDPMKELLKQVQQQNTPKVPERPSHSESQPSLSSYHQLHKCGVSNENVAQKMRVDGHSEDTINGFLESLAKSAAGEKDTQEVKKHANKIRSGGNGNRLNEDELNKLRDELKCDPALEKYFKMLKMRLPSAAVVQKMNMEALDPQQVMKFCQAFAPDLIEGEHTSESEEPENNGTEEAALSEEQLEQLRAELQGNPTFEKYCKMLKMRLPSAAVVQKMNMEGLAEDQVRRFCQGFAPEMLPQGTQAKTPAKPQESRQKKSTSSLKKLHWNAIPKGRLANSVWAKEVVSTSVSLEDDDVEELIKNFSSKPAPQTNAKSVSCKRVGSSKSKEVRLLDLKRANNINIGLAQFRHLKIPHGLVAAIKEAQTKVLTPTKLTLLKGMLPSGSELRVVTDYKGNLNKLGKAEHFFFELSKLKHFEGKIEALLFISQFVDHCTQISKSVNQVTSACEEVLQSAKLGVVFGIILNVGNTMNAGTFKGGVDGFTLDSLLKLTQTRANDNRTTIVDYIVRTVNKKNKELLDYTNDLTSVNDASRVHVGDLKRMAAKESKGMERVHQVLETIQSAGDDADAYIPLLKEFIANGNSILESLNSQVSNMQVACEKVSRYLGEDPDAGEPSHIFKVLKQFNDTFKYSRMKLRL